MNGIEGHFSKGYDLNELISIITRYFSINSENEKLILSEALDNILNILLTNKLYLIHSDKYYVEANKNKLNKIFSISYSLFNLGFINNDQYKKINLVLNLLKKEIEIFISKYSSKVQCIIQDFQVIDNLFGVKGIFNDYENFTCTELKKYSESENYIKKNLELNNISISLAKQITKYSIVSLLNCKEININIIGLKDSEKHLLLWNSTESKLNYYIPNLSISEYLLFDIPHNMVHLIHLNKINNGVSSYYDSMKNRSFFEALAVLGENFIYESLNSNNTVSDDIHYFFTKEIKNSISKEEFHEWMLKNRSFEFKLRIIRYIGDYLLISGKSFNETINIIYNLTKINKIKIENEIIKYISELGLGAIYSFGYNKLIDSGYKNPGEILNLDNVPKTWEEFNNITINNEKL